MLHSPKCQSKQIHRPRSKSLWERCRKEITGKQPHRCGACNWRGWLTATGATDELAGSYSRAKAIDPPNLAGTSLARPDTQVQINLEALDRFHSPLGKDDLSDNDDA
jgi:hypothetical protein